MATASELLSTLPPTKRCDSFCLPWSQTPKSSSSLVFEAYKDHLSSLSVSSVPLLSSHSSQIEAVPLLLLSFFVDEAGSIQPS